MLWVDRNEITTEDDDSTHFQRKILEDFRKLNCSENADEEELQQRIKEVSKL